MERAAAGLDAEAIARRRKWTPQRIVHAIHALRAKGVPLHGKSVYNTDQGIVQAARKLFGSWNAALAAAGFDPATIRQDRQRLRVFLTPYDERTATCRSYSRGTTAGRRLP